MRRSHNSLLEVETELRRAELERAARAHVRDGLLPVQRAEHGRSWRAAVGRRLMRLGARLAALDATEHVPALRGPRLGPTA